jgi:copper transport protein
LTTSRPHSHPISRSRLPLLERASPPVDGILGAPPSRIELWLTEAAATGPDSPSLGVLDEDGSSLTVSDLRLDPADPRHLTATVSGVGFGTYTVTWSVRSEVDGHTLTGSYAFRVGGTDRAPGAATVEGETPRAWAVATRWSTFLAAGIATAGLIAGPLLFGSRESPATARRRLLVVLGAAIVGAFATLLEPALQSIAPPEGLLAPSIGDTFNALPDGWFLRVPGFVGLAVAALLLLIRPRLPVVRYLGALGGLAALLGLALTSHASAREDWRLAAVASVILHQWSVGLWSGGLIHLLLGRAAPRPEGQPSPVQRFSFWALPLATVGILTGAINAGFVLPTFDIPWESNYGRVLIAKIAILFPVLILAGFHRLKIRRVVDGAVSAIGPTLWLETLLVALIILGGSGLALLAPPSLDSGNYASVDLAAPFEGPTLEGERGPFARLRITPARTGENAFAVAVTDGRPLFLDEEIKIQAAPLLTDVALVRLTLRNLISPIAPLEVPLEADGTGWFYSTSVQLGLEGWWQVDVTVRRTGLEDVTVPFYIILPDPNVHGEEAVRPTDSRDEARLLFERGLADLTSLTSLHYTQLLNGGTGTSGISDHITHSALGTQPAALLLATNEIVMIRSGGSQWVSKAGGEWSRTDAPAVVPLSAWGSDYVGATGFRLGIEESVGGRPARIITFYVPGDQYAPASYAWWIDVETGHILREAMVSRGHYMAKTYDGFNSAPPVIPPD